MKAARLSVLGYALVAACLCAQAQSDTDAQEAAKPAAARSAQPIDRIVAIVNEEVITQIELDRRLDLAISQLQKQGTPPPSRRELSRQMLERMIYNMLQQQFAKEVGLRVEDAQLDRAVQGIARDNGMGMGEFRSALQRDGVAFDKFRDDVRTELTIQRVREREIDSKLTVSEGEVDTQLQTDAQRPAGVGEEELLVAHILIRLPEQATPEEIEERNKRAQEALAALKKGTDFGQVSATYSDAEEALKGGSLGWRRIAKLPTLYVDALGAMKNGELSAILRSGNGFHIVKLLDQRGKGGAQAVAQTRARHILVKTSDSVSEAEARRRIEQIKRRLADGADFAETARTSSEDATASKGGELGWVYAGDTVPQFEQAMNALAPGQVSEPVQTPFGWHLIEVLERKEAEVSAERNRAAARQAIRQRKADEAYQEWLRQLRDRAYVEYRLDERL